MSVDNELQELPVALTQEIVDILMDSEMYLELPLEERNKLLRHIAQKYFFPATNKSNNTATQIFE